MLQRVWVAQIAAQSRNEVFRTRCIIDIVEVRRVMAHKDSGPIVIVVEHTGLSYTRSSFRYGGIAQGGVAEFC